MDSMNKLSISFLLFLLPGFWLPAQQPFYPAPYGALPDSNQLRWHEMERYVLIHFTPTTFENKEWGYGDADPALFNPVAFDAGQIVNAAKEGGFKGVVLVAKHHDGFCLWPTATTSYNISKSPWKKGTGDMVREFEQATRKAGLEFGLYCSAWDRHDSDYGRCTYVKKYREQLRELFSNYGPLFIAWFDGANGGEGYYGGARVTRTIDRAAYYGWDTIWQMVRRMQPGAVIFSDVGDIRWVGNETGHAAETSWATFTPEPLDGKTKAVPGEMKYWKSPEGTRNGKYWKPAECDVPLRPGWYYHPGQDDQVKNAVSLFDLYLRSVGRGAGLDLGLSPDTTGRLAVKDVLALKAFGGLLDQTFANDLALKAALKASNTRNNHPQFGVENLIDHDRYSYWSTDDTVTSATVELFWKEPVTFRLIRLRENIRLGQRIERIEMDVLNDEGWSFLTATTSIGSNRLVLLPAAVTCRGLRIRIVQSPVCIALSEINIF